MTYLDDELLNTKQVAEILKFHRQSVWKLIKRGELPCIRFGRRGIRVARRDLDEFIKTHKFVR
jgi:excisionase family DNA binding protein